MINIQKAKLAGSIDSSNSNPRVFSGNVAIMTWYHYRNYGTALQSTALFKIISEMGFSPKMIQYRPVGNILQKMNFELFCKKAYRWVLKYLFGPREYHSSDREELFSDFLSSRLDETAPIKTENDFVELNSLFDAFVCGSDQIWSPLDFNDKYYLSFVKNKRKKIAYAPSLGVSDIADSEIKRRITALLRDFRHLSVREIQGAEIIKNLTGQTAKIVLDPTLLLSDEEWDNYAEVSSASKLPQPYILCYFLGQPSRYRKTCQRLAEKWELPIYEIPTVIDDGKYADFPFEVGPREFVSLIKNAAFVFTDSFHGMIFSIIYQIPFAVFERFEHNDPQNQNSRIYSLLDLLDLSDRLMDVIDPKEIDRFIKEETDDAVVYQRLANLRKGSIDYLNRSLNDAVSC